MNDHPYTETVAAPGKGVLAGFGTAVLFLMAGLLFPPLLIVGVICLVASPLMGLVNRTGPCPNCDTEIHMQRKSQWCPCCGHRLTLKGSRLMDVS